MTEEYNMSMRKFLKQVGVTSQQAIEEALRNRGDATGPFKIRAVVTCEDLDLQHEVTGTIKAGE